MTGNIEKQEILCMLAAEVALTTTAAVCSQRKVGVKQEQLPAASHCPFYLLK